MAEQEAGANFLTRKIGPFPVIVWGAGVFALYYVYSKRKPAPTAGPTALTPSGTIATTGGIGSSDLSGSAGGGSTGATGTSGATVAGQYATNDAWAHAAINYLVGIGIDPTAANSAVTQFLASQNLTADQQADVNLAIQSIGAPPSPPAPGTAPPPIVAPPGGTVYAANPPTGLAVQDKTATSATLTWNRATNATSYTVGYTDTGTGQHKTASVGGTDSTITLSDLAPSRTYTFTVQGVPARSGDPFASVTDTTPGATAAPPPPAPTPAPPPPADPHAGMHLQPPQVATLEAGRSLRDLARGLYGPGYQPHLDILVSLNPGEGGPDHRAAVTHEIRTSNERWVPN